MQEAEWPPGETEMARYIRARDWSDLALGTTETWAQKLKTVAELALSTGQAKQFAWGGALAQRGGRVCIAWSIEGTGPDPITRHLLLDCREIAVAMPADTPGVRYRTELVTKALPYQLGAETLLQFKGDGVRCRIVLPAGVFSEGQDMRA